MYTKKKLLKILSFVIIYLSTSIFSLSITSDALSKIFKIEEDISEIQEAIDEQNLSDF